jgi:putative alpha-1,2-mannosidase
VDGKAATATFLPESFVLKGGTLEFTLGKEPNRNWGVGERDRPPSFDVQ